MITKHETNLANYNFDHGEMILVDKPFGWSSFKVVYKVKQALHVKKVGHSGTLDPYATGLLILATGKKTRELTQFLLMDKTYMGTITLGKTTISMDAETDVILERPIDGITEEDINRVKEEFLGQITQVPPMHSAVSVKGKKLYELARKGETVPRPPRTVTVYDFKIIKVELPEIHFEIRCSKGTYIRVIANDFGEKLGCGAYLSSLRRTKVGFFSVDDAFSTELFVQEAKKAFAHLKKPEVKKKPFVKKKAGFKPKKKMNPKFEKKNGEYKPHGEFKPKFRPKPKFRKGPGQPGQGNSDKKW